MKQRINEDDDTKKQLLEELSERYFQHFVLQCEAEEFQKRQEPRMFMKKISFVYQQDDNRKINLIQMIAGIWYSEDGNPVYDEEYEWARCLYERKQYFPDNLLFNRPSLVGALIANPDIIWVKDGGPHPKTLSKKREEAIRRSYLR